ncbi:bifunctional adenosylcobinamide kinase/adenosylcobinamide-phosphate guanylyltransferase [Paremcibacter congregatus]|uniref:Bifunctional adenosylcobalamin biosynthesis protein n=1 Tax=Paremcibacter congregatus TaxID=2043170 RepID=A0A2G4YTJ6_9PROT|nr:bifunctional adenosylcobinamide kinase/adenosylcobinamide-phosphate guanylyltransferase [Paremcibacter congregatus]PHZ85651.1 bifunctional adenosylcobinamide kinase/adenosylcobinamide-phosphate guanylyltransferase [Paremcibacter congregatus]QDE26611.1 bifunctional adenosylcobinamide kinase/adenosylcobinamide-phosphate guanylyltransferase [Paremcibacter congregatus]
MTEQAITLVIGGARSGKSSFAERLAEDSGKKLYYIATAEAHDAEMAARIADHQKRREDRWITIQEPLDLARVVSETAATDRVILVDCLTLWLSNIMCRDGDVEAYCEDLLAALKNIKGPVIFVANEVGLGIVPENKMARDFRDDAGRLNQAVARLAHDVHFMAAGLSLCMKRDGNPQQ